MADKQFVFPATVLSIHDGDTLRLDLDLGFGMHQVELSCRVFGINAPELSTQAGKDAAAYLKSILPIGASVTVTSMGWDKYGGRYDGKILYGTIDIGQNMLDSGHAVPLA